MPEGDTVWLSARRMHAALAGHTLTVSDFRLPTLATTDLTGRDVLEVASRGKHMLTRIEGGVTLHTHFRMDGRWQVLAQGRPWQGGSDWQVRVVLANAHWQAIGYRLPVVDLVETAAEADLVGHLGPDLLGADWDLDEAVRRLASQPERAIAEALLDQRNLAGIGNLYKAESLFLRGLHPWTRVADVADLPALVGVAHRLLMANRDRWDQVTTGDLRRGRQHWVFERQRRPCRRCGTTVLVAEQGEDPRTARITYWCPSCQPDRR
jgi:endonuclease VIII